MKHIHPFLVLLLIASFSITSLAQSDCPALVEFALNSTDEICQNTERNQACFGHIDLSVEAQPDANSFEFVEVGDIVNVAAIRSLRLSTLDTSAGAWGVVLMRVQANLPDSIPGQNITFMLFGDTEIRNNATSVAEQNIPTLDAQINSSINANAHIGPNETAPVLASIPNGTAVIANGIAPNNEWIRIVIPNSKTDQFGWVSTQLITTSDDLSTLNVITPGQSQFGPMQAFYLSTGIGAPACNEMPENGLLVQTPKGVGEINLLVNEVEISMGSTVFLSAPRNENDSDNKTINVNSMQVKTIEGAAITRINGEPTVALGGSQFEVLFDEAGEIEALSEVIGLKIEEIDNLPYSSLERVIEFVEPLTDKELDILDKYDDVFDLVDIEETGALLNYLEESGDDNLIEFLQDNLDIDTFDAETAEFFEDELGIDVEGFEIIPDGFQTEDIDIEPIDVQIDDFDIEPDTEEPDTEEPDTEEPDTEEPDTEEPEEDGG